MYFATFGVGIGTAPQQGFISSWKTDNLSSGSSTNVQIKLPLIDSGTYDFMVDWGDGNSDSITSYDQAEVTHTYDIIGTYTITIIGQLEGFRFNNGEDRYKILEISQWGSGTKLGTSEGNYFYGCSNLNITALDALNCDGLTSMYLGLANNTVNNSPLTWLSSGTVTTFHALLLSNFAFNRDLSVLDFSSITSLQATLYGCSSFNKNLVLNTSPLLTNCRSMLSSCTNFNGDLDFNTQNVSDFDSFLSFCTSFNKTLDNLDFGNATILSSLLFNCTSFNQDLPIDMSYAYTLSSAFTQCSSLVVADFTNKDLSSLQQAVDCFRGCTSLTTINLTNVNLGSNLKTLQGFAFGCTALTDIIGLDTLDVSTVTNMTNFMNASTIPTTRYSNALIYWATLTLRPNVVCNMGGSKYNALGETARNYIIATFNWTFEDGGLEV